MAENPPDKKPTVSDDKNQPDKKPTVSDDKNQPDKKPTVSDAKNQPSRRITDLKPDVFAQCVSSLSFQDLANISLVSKSFKKLVYSDLVWLDPSRAFRSGRWFSSDLGARNSYLRWRTAANQFNTVDPFVTSIVSQGISIDNVILDRNDIIFSQGPVVRAININPLLRTDTVSHTTMTGHTSRVTCLRLFPLKETSLTQSHTEENVLITSNCDGSIRLWWKGVCLGRFGKSVEHNPFKHTSVLTLSDKLLGNASPKVLASGERSGAICLWSLISGEPEEAPQMMCKGSDEPVKFMTVSGYESSKLVTMSKDSEVRVWDTTNSLACVGLASVNPKPVDMKCDGNMLYVAAGSSVDVLDLREMKQVMTVAVSQPKIFALTIMPSRSLVCTGGSSRALLWDIRKSQGKRKPEPITELLGSHQLGVCPISYVHTDPSKIVIGGWTTNIFDAWNINTYEKTLCFVCGNAEHGCSAMAVNAGRIVTAFHTGTRGHLNFIDFS